MLARVVIPKIWSTILLPHRPPPTLFHDRERLSATSLSGSAMPDGLLRTSQVSLLITAVLICEANRGWHLTPATPPSPSSSSSSSELLAFGRPRATTCDHITQKQTIWQYSPPWLSAICATPHFPSRSAELRSSRFVHDKRDFLRLFIVSLIFLPYYLSLLPIEFSTFHCSLKAHKSLVCIANWKVRCRLYSHMITQWRALTFLNLKNTCATGYVLCQKSTSTLLDILTLMCKLITR